MRLEGITVGVPFPLHHTFSFPIISTWIYHQEALAYSNRTVLRFSCITSLILFHRFIPPSHTLFMLLLNLADCQFPGLLFHQVAFFHYLLDGSPTLLLHPRHSFFNFLLASCFFSGTPLYLHHFSPKPRCTFFYVCLCVFIFFFLLLFSLSLQQETLLLQYRFLPYCDFGWPFCFAEERKWLLHHFCGFLAWFQGDKKENLRFWQQSKPRCYSARLFSKSRLGKSAGNWSGIRVGVSWNPILKHRNTVLINPGRLWELLQLASFLSQGFDIFRFWPGYMSSILHENTTRFTPVLLFTCQR